MHSWGKFWTKDQKHSTATSESQEQKQGTCPLHTPPPKGWANHLRHPSGPTPGHTPSLTPYKEPAHPSSGSKQGKLLLVFAPSCGGRSPSKALPEFLGWPSINFYWLGKAKNPGRYQICSLNKFASLAPSSTDDSLSTAHVHPLPHGRGKSAWVWRTSSVSPGTTWQWLGLHKSSVWNNTGVWLEQRLSTSLKILRKGLPWWRSGWESACQCRGHGFGPWSGKIPHAAEWLGPWATTTEPARLEPVFRNKRPR